MNWDPRHYYQRKDGRWFNSYGEEGTMMTLKELLDREDKNNG